MNGVASLSWFARHELRLVWRDWLGMLQAGRRRRRLAIVAGVGLFLLLLHLIGYAVLRPYAAAWRPDRAGLLALTGSVFLAWTLMLSQALESATRAFYSRADLDLILSSPASAAPIFALRIGAIALAITGMALLLFGPFINVMAALAGPRFLAGYGLLVVMGTTAAALATWLTILLFRLVGARRTRLIAQIVAAVIGAGFVIGVQAFAIVSYGNLSRVALFQSAGWIAAAPGPESLLWWPARAATGDLPRLLLLLAAGLFILAATVQVHARAFAAHATSVVGVAAASAPATPARDFRPLSGVRSLRRKEWLLLWRDPWLVSQSLMQLLYLLPPALLLWRNFGQDVGHLAILAPVVVMTAGQLAGGLAWLAISGEDAPDLVATAPIRPAVAMRAKVEAVLAAVALPVLPFTLALAFASPGVAGLTLAFALLAAIGSIAIQVGFRAQARRSQFRRRQTSSRLATFAEAFSSIAVAAAAGLAAAGSWCCIAPLALAGSIAVLVLRYGPGSSR